MVRHLVTIDDLSETEIEAIFSLTDDFLARLGTPGKPHRVQGRETIADKFILATLFYEASTRTRFLRTLPAVWAMISWPFSSFTRKVALGSSSLTVPGNSRSSSFAIRPLGCFARRGDCTEPAEKQAMRVNHPPREAL